MGGGLNATAMPTTASVDRRYGNLRITRDRCGAASVGTRPKEV